MRDKEGANFCDWFRPRPEAHRPRGGEKTQAAKARLDDLFGGTQTANTKPESARDKLGDLFGAGKKPGK
ncbi:hypothetical protein SCL_0540 [Sulfuricaulis limicola]|uniref:Uncharacterized protein n=1 Tax=Sulfuricaulis limicola TaxID=1620215 RepID=A0A1B4XDJ0_9GAMM|nr:hypothetical protein SCL_0540 [Sulfuricaulis limicola]